MSKECQICGKRYQAGNTRSHSNIATKKKRQINLQKTQVAGKTVKACTKCIKTQAKPARKAK